MLAKSRQVRTMFLPVSQINLCLANETSAHQEHDQRNWVRERRGPSWTSTSYFEASLDAKQFTACRIPLRVQASRPDQTLEVTAIPEPR